MLYLKMLLLLSGCLFLAVFAIKWLIPFLNQEESSADKSLKKEVKEAEKLLKKYKHKLHELDEKQRKEVAAAERLIKDYNRISYEKIQPKLRKFSDVD